MSPLLSIGQVHVPTPPGHGASVGQFVWCVFCSDPSYFTKMLGWVESNEYSDYTYCVAPGAGSASVGTLVAWIDVDEDAGIVVQVDRACARPLATRQTRLGYLCRRTGLTFVDGRTRQRRWRNATIRSGEKCESDGSDDESRGGLEELHRDYDENCLPVERGGESS